MFGLNKKGSLKPVISGITIVIVLLLLFVLIKSTGSNSEGQESTILSIFDAILTGIAISFGVGLIIFSIKKSAKVQLGLSKMNDYAEHKNFTPTLKKITGFSQEFRYFQVLVSRLKDEKRVLESQKEKIEKLFKTINDHSEWAGNYKIPLAKRRNGYEILKSIKESEFDKLIKDRPHLASANKNIEQFFEHLIKDELKIEKILGEDSEELKEILLSANKKDRVSENLSSEKITAVEAEYDNNKIFIDLNLERIKDEMKVYQVNDPTGENFEYEHEFDEDNTKKIKIFLRCPKCKKITKKNLNEYIEQYYDKQGKMNCDHCNKTYRAVLFEPIYHHKGKITRRLTHLFHNILKLQEEYQLETDSESLIDASENISQYNETIANLLHLEKRQIELMEHAIISEIPKLNQLMKGNEKIQEDLRTLILDNKRLYQTYHDFNLMLNEHFKLLAKEETNLTQLVDHAQDLDQGKTKQYFDELVHLVRLLYENYHRMTKFLGIRSFDEMLSEKSIKSFRENKLDLGENGTHTIDSLRHFKRSGPPSFENRVAYFFWRKKHLDILLDKKFKERNQLEQHYIRDSLIRFIEQLSRSGLIHRLENESHIAAIIQEINDGDYSDYDMIERFGKFADQRYHENDYTDPKDIQQLFEDFLRKQ